VLLFAVLRWARDRHVRERPRRCVGIRTRASRAPRKMSHPVRLDQATADQKDPDFLSVLDAREPRVPRSKERSSPPCRRASHGGNEAHHFGYTANARSIFARARLLSNRLNIIDDVATDPKHRSWSQDDPRHAASTGTGPAHLLRRAGRRDDPHDARSKEGRRAGRAGEARQRRQLHRGACPRRPTCTTSGSRPELNVIVTSSWAHPKPQSRNTPMKTGG